MLKRTLLAVLLASVSTEILASPGHAQEAPFGLTWGMTREQLTGLGLTLDQVAEDHGIIGLKCPSAPKNLSTADYYVLYLDSKFGLQKILMDSKHFVGDSLGSEGKKAYADLKQKLISKYGATKSEMERVGVKVWKESDEFYQCLGYDGCGMWASIFEVKDQGLTIAIQLQGAGRGDGYLQIVYEGPKWKDSLERAKSEKSASDKDAL